MLPMFADFTDMVDTQEERKIARHEEYRNDKPWMFIDTCSVTDSTLPYETAISHLEYVGEWCVVEQYATFEEAERGHKKWVALMTAPFLPAQLTDIWARDEHGVSLVYPHKPLPEEQA